MRVQFLVHFSIGFSLFLVDFSTLYILNMHHLSFICHKYFLPHCGLLFHPLMVSPVNYYAKYYPLFCIQLLPFCVLSEISLSILNISNLSFVWYKVILQCCLPGALMFYFSHSDQDCVRNLFLCMIWDKSPHSFFPMWISNCIEIYPNIKLKKLGEKWHFCDVKEPTHKKLILPFI